MELQAVIIADGTVAGDRDAINAIVAARARAYQDTGKPIAMLTRMAPVTDFVAWRKESVPVPVPMAPVRMPSPDRTVVPQRVIKFLNDGKSETEIVQILNDWRDRLAQTKPAIPTTPRPERGVL